MPLTGERSSLAPRECSKQCQRGLVPKRMALPSGDTIITSRGAREISLSVFQGLTSLGYDCVIASGFMRRRLLAVLLATAHIATWMYHRHAARHFAFRAWHLDHKIQQTVEPNTGTSATHLHRSIHMTSMASSNSVSDEHSVSSGTSGQGSRAELNTSNASSRSGQELLEEKERMFQNESKQVTRLKRIVLLIMILAAIAVSTVVYFITANSQQTTFAAQYEGASEKLLGKQKRKELPCHASILHILILTRFSISYIPADCSAALGRHQLAHGGSDGSWLGLQVRVAFRDTLMVPAPSLDHKKSFGSHPHNHEPVRNFRPTRPVGRLLIQQ